MEMKQQENKNELNNTFDIELNEQYLCFSRMGGAGVIKCRDCGYEEKIISFTHGMMSCSIGRQCPECHSFVVEDNESQEYHVMGKSENDFVCPKCGAVIRKKEEHISKGNDDPLVCPKCQSQRLDYHMSYIT